MPRHNNPCTACADGGPACDICQTSPENSALIRLYTPKGAARAMLAGKVLEDDRGWLFFWEDRGSSGAGFWFKDNDGKIFTPRDFSGLHEDYDRGKRPQ